MKYGLPRLALLVIILLIFVYLPLALQAQKAAAELIASASPPKGKVVYEDGARQVTVYKNHLFITNFWAGLQVIDITNMQNPEQSAFLPTDDLAYTTDIEGDKAYLANEASGVQIYNISDLHNIFKLTQVKTPGNAYWVVAEYPHIYVALGKAGFAIMDITDLNNPIVEKLEVTGEWVQQIYKKDNLLYLAAKKNGLLIYDISNMERPQRLSQFRTGFNAMKVQVEGNIAYVADGSGGMVTINVKNPKFPVEVARFSKIGFVNDLFKAGNYVYLANRDVGLQIVNMSDPENPYLENTYTTDDINYGVYKLDIYVFLAANNTTLIMRHNNAPTLKDITDQQLVENSPFSLQLQADEADGDSIYYEAFNLPEGATFDKKTGYFSWTPTYEQSGVYKNVRFRVVELTGSNLSASDTIDLSVAHVNRLPDLPSLPDTTIEEQQLLTLSIPEGSDPDKEDQNNLTYRAETLPEGTQFDPMTREFSWTPTYEQSGLYTVDFLIDDGAGGIDREPVTITVKHVDRKPSIDPIADQTIDEVDTLTLTLTGTEPDSEDQDKISFVMENLPEGANFDPASRLFTWTPTYDQSGSYQNILATMIGGKLRDSTSFSIEVNHVNRAPVLAEISDQSVDENKVLSFKIEGSDPDVEDSGKLAYSATDLPQGATFNEDSLIFQWQPTYEQSGTYPDITFTVNDPSGLSDSKTISISVNHVNRAPTIAEVENKTVNENESLEFQLSATDPDKEDQGKLAFSAVGLPEGATLDSQTGAFQWVPTYEQSGEYPVTFMISDQEFTDSTQMQVSVLHVNRSPSLASIEPKTVDENQLLNFVIEGSDPDQEDQGLLSYSATDLPQGAVFDSTTRSLEWMPTYEQSGNYAVNFTVTDPAGLSDQKTANLTVNHVNRSPSLQPVAAQTVDENQPLTFQLVGEDFDQEDTGKLVYSMDNLPEGATVDPAAGTFSWTPTYEQSGEYTLTAQVQDASQLSATQPVTITVNHVNRPPEFTELPAQNGEENAVLQFSLQASDPDQEDTGKLTYTAENLPQNATLQPSSGEFSWTPTYEQSGEYDLSFRVTDSFGVTDTMGVTINIAHVNRPPTLTTVQNFTFQENQAGSFTIPQGQDPDQEDAGKLTYAVEGLPEGAVFTSGERTVNWTPTFDQAGEYPLTATVSDPAGLSASQSFQVTVENVNRPPQLTELPPQTGQENSLLQFALQATDPDQEDAGKLTYSSVNLPEGARLDGSTGQFSWTPSFEQSGEYQVTFQVEDGFGATATTDVAITIEHVNRPPEISQITNYDLKEDEQFQTTLLLAEDPDREDAGKLTYQVEGLPQGANFDAATRQLSWTPTFEQAGNYPVTYVVKDPVAESRQDFNLNVENVNRPPEIQSPGNQSVKEGEELKFKILANDPDAEDEGQLQIEMKNSPSGASFNNSVNEFVWTPDSTHQGDYTVGFVVKDKAGATDQVSVSIQVQDVPENPPTP